MLKENSLLILLFVHVPVGDMFGEFSVLASTPDNNQNVSSYGGAHTVASLYQPTHALQKSPPTFPIKPQ